MGDPDFGFHRSPFLHRLAAGEVVMSDRSVFLTLGAVLGGASLIGGAMITAQADGGPLGEIAAAYVGIPLVLVGLVTVVITLVSMLNPPTSKYPPPPPPPPPPDLPRARAHLVEKQDPERDRRT